MLKGMVFSLLVFVTLLFSAYSDTRAKRAINPFLDSMGKRAVNPFLDSFGKRSSRYQPYYHLDKRYFDSLAGQALGKRSIQAYDA
ncbi:hypothetical protein V3C99_017347 [Haemonchus contortus]|uniref:Uncharacterized protein n=3 Tax=Haemonchus TaxID=6288 RepID=A0A0N4X7L3_HAEPC|nr:unnamed protein product [Haemonchus placei]